MKTSYDWKLLSYLRPYRLRLLWALAQVFTGRCHRTHSRARSQNPSRV
jgi:hypothetical protein